MSYDNVVLALVPWPFSKQKTASQKAPVVCTIDFGLSDDYASIRRLIQCIQPFLANPNGSPETHIDLANVQYLGPYAATVLLASHLVAKQRKLPLKFIFPSSPSKVRAFTHFSGLDHWLHNGSAPDVSHPENVTIPLSIAKTATYNYTDPIIQLVHKHAVISDDDETYLRNAVNEVIQNVEDHAQSEFGAVYCARYLDKPKKIRVAIVDCGLGIRTTLLARYPDIGNAEEALRQVVQGGISAKSRPNNMGIGVSNLWSQITGPLKGDIFIVTEEAIGYCDKTQQLRINSLGTRFAGTGVFFTVPVSGTTQEKA